MRPPGSRSHTQIVTGADASEECRKRFEVVRAVGRAVVDDDDLAIHTGLAERVLRLPHDIGDTRDLVEAGENHRDRSAHGGEAISWYDAGTGLHETHRSRPAPLAHPGGRAVHSPRRGR